MVTFVNFLFQIKIINTISGFGHLILTRSFLKKLFWKIFLKNIILKSDKVIVQNNDDLKFLKNNGYKKAKIIYPNIKKSLLNVKNIKQTPYNKKIIFLMYSRIIKEKGVSEFIVAARKLYNQSSVEFILVGNIDNNNPSTFSKKDIKKIKKNKFLKYYTHTDKIFDFIKISHIIVLPSYREGLPGSLLEALYFAKPIISSNVPGCRECVINNFNGFLVPVKKSNLLIKKMSKYIKNKKLIDLHSYNSKKLYLKKFNKNSNLEYYKIYSDLLK